MPSRVALVHKRGDVGLALEASLTPRSLRYSSSSGRPGLSPWHRR